MRWIAAVMIVFAGCGNAPDCKTAVEKAFAQTHAADMKLAGKVVELCEQQGWSASVRSCLAKATADKDAEACLKDTPMYDDMSRKVEDTRKQAIAERQAALAAEAARDAAAKVEAMQKQLDDTSTKLDTAVDAVAKAQNDVDRAAAKAKLEALRRQKADIEAQAAESRAAAARAQRAKGVQISKECLDNPLAKGCN